MGERITRAEFAKRLGVSPAHITQAVKRGDIDSGPDKKIDADELERYQASRQSIRSKKPDAAPAVKRGPGRPAAPAPEPADIGEADQEITYRDAQRLKEIYAARLAKLKYEEQAGLLIDADQVKKAAFGQARKVRDQLLAIPDRIAPMLVGLETYHEAHSMLTKEIRKVLEGLGGMDDDVRG